MSGEGRGDMREESARNGDRGSVGSSSVCGDRGRLSPL